MALTGWSTSNYLLNGAAPVSAMPLTLACWAWSPVNNTFMNLMGLYNSGSAENRNCYKLQIESLGSIRAATGDATTEAFAEATIDIATSTWFHGAAVFTSATSRACLLNGASKGTNATSKTPASAPNRVIMGVGGGTPIATPHSSTGLIAEAGIWDVALTDEEIGLLAKGISPSNIRPGNLVSYMPLIRDVVDVVFGGLGVTGSLSAAAHPRVFN